MSPYARGGIPLGCVEGTRITVILKYASSTLTTDSSILVVFLVQSITVLQGRKKILFYDEMIGFVIGFTSRQGPSCQLNHDRLDEHLLEISTSVHEFSIGRKTPSRLTMFYEFEEVYLRKSCVIPRVEYLNYDVYSGY
jgi:hypothetical protein